MLDENADEDPGCECRTVSFYIYNQYSTVYLCHTYGSVGQVPCFVIPNAGNTDSPHLAIGVLWKGPGFHESMQRSIDIDPASLTRTAISTAVAITLQIS